MKNNMTKPARASIISARDLTRVYALGPARVVGVEGIDLDVCAGEMVVIKGNSGSGKSTLLSLLAGLDHFTRGRLSVAGYDLNAISSDQLTRFRRQVVGMVFQSFNLLPTLTVEENICLPALLAGKPERQVQSDALHYCQWLDIESRRDHLPSQLSGGQMQRVAIARALINDPQIILADEPTGNLDSRNGETVMKLLAELNRRWNRTVIIATHSTLADDYATVRICLKDGRLAESICDG